MHHIILIITSSFDSTVDYIISKYKDEYDFFRVDVDKFDDYRISVGLLDDWRITFDNTSISKADVLSIYYRKPYLPDLSDYEVPYQSMIARDIISLINGITDEYKGIVLTRPSILRKAENKTLQLLLASKIGFTLPQSIIGNDNNVFSSFLGNNTNIIKPLTTGKLKTNEKIELYQTNYIRELKEDISLTPIYVQRYIEKKYEVRLTCIEQEKIAVKIESRNKLDWRKDYTGLQYAIIECPFEISNLCDSLMSELQLKFGAFDFIVDKDGSWIFLEINPNGQWLWLENELDLNISSSILKVLSKLEGSIIY